MVMNNVRKETKYIVIHSSDTKPSQNYSVSDLDKQHRKDGLFSCAYHKIITRNGDIQNGRDIQIAGAHVDSTVKLSNKNSIGVCLIGGQSEDGTPDCNYTFKQYEALLSLLNDLKNTYKDIEIVGHRDVSDSVSPHFNVVELLRT
jgi:N-acetylmuramoyl-L-alanine amidase